MDLNLQVERRFGFSSDQVPANVGQIWALAQGLVDKGESKPAPPQWFRPLSETGVASIKGDTFAEAFVNRALANRGDVILFDDLSGLLTYERVLVGALSMSRRLAKLPRPNVGLLLPASAASDIAFMGLHLAGKLPVLLNWTTGPANLEHAAQVMELDHVVTSRAFIDRTAIEVKGTQYLFLEDLRGTIGKLELLWTLLRVRWFPGSIRKQVPHPDPHQPAVVLFTSGSEKAPKAVPLTHSNVLSNQKSGIPFLGFQREDAILGFLPAFHSFGMSVTGLLPLLSGIRVVRHPDPTDAGGLVRKIDAFKTTLLVGTPTFVSYILERAQPGQLNSLRLIIVGAEKCPQAVFDRCRELAPNATLIEGYGITECSPVVSTNPPQANRPGTIGKPLPGVEVCVIDLETDQLLGPNQLGMLHVAGPTIFPGYFGYDGPSPFRELNGKRWYITGDLARLDNDGYLHFGGRLKRFLKIGGEMVSLPALEEPLARLRPPTDKGPQVAVEGIEGEGKRKIVLFTTDPGITLGWANEQLEEAGFQGIMRLDEVRHLPSVPVLGTGKTDYKVLRAQIQEA
jgi:long-chain-fatty-acid--[acyl-carrier-protein] ligase